MMGSDHEGRPLCKLCIESNGVFICPRCRKPGKRHSKAKCQLCYWRELGGQRLMEFDSSLKHDWLRHEFRLFFDDLSLHRDPQRATFLITKYGNFFTTIDAAVNTSTDLSYDLLGQLFWKNGLHKHKVAISFLIRRGYLPELKTMEWEALIQRMAQHRLLDRIRDVGHYQVLVEYYEFLQHHVRRNRKFNWVTPKERPKPRTITINLQTAHHFLSFVGIKSRDELRHLHQNILDRYLYEHPGYRNAVRPFIWYLNKIVRIFKTLHIPTEVKGIRKNLILPDEKVSELLAVWLAAEGDDTRMALTGLLMLLYCQEPHTIATIKISDIQLKDTDVAQISVGKTYLEVEPEVGQVLRRYLFVRRPLCISEHHWENPYLFPGQLARSHVHPETIGGLLKRAGVSAEQLFATGVSNAFAAGVPSPKILVNTVGITLPTAMKYFYAQNPMQANYASEHLANK